MTAPPAAMKPSPSIPLPRLDVAKKRALRLLLGEHVESGLSVTVSAMRKLGAKVAGKPFTQELAQGALSDLGYVVGPDLMATAGTKGQLKTECIWIPAPLDRPLSKAERAKLLSNRLAVLSEAFVADLLEDPQLAYAELNERAIEASRMFAQKLGEAVSSRARFGFKEILGSCADASSFAFRAAKPPVQKTAERPESSPS